ncbi:MAG: glutamyl-tRNA reductase [Chloroflexota bacterium]
MPFLALGVEHKTSPLVVREAALVSPEAAADALGSLHQHVSIDEIALLATCNRVELYLFVNDPADAAAASAAYLATIDSRLSQYVQTWEEMDAVEHLFRVASGLESQIVGEAQILSQVRDALVFAQGAGALGPNLHSLFRSAISCARQARAGTGLGRVNLSAGSEAVSAAEKLLGALTHRSALIIGGGEISRLVARSLEQRSIGAMYIANRTEAVAIELADRFGARPVRFADITSVMAHVDVVFSATSALHAVLTADDLPAGLQTRSMPLQIFDLAVPRDVDAEVGSEPGVQLHDLESILPIEISDGWREDIRSMESVIAAEIQGFRAWYLTRRVVPVIAHLRSHVEAVSSQELRRVAPQLAGLNPREHEAVESLTQRLIDKMFHHLVVRLRLAAQTDPSLVDAAEFFFLHGEGGLFEHAEQSENAHPLSRESQMMEDAPTQ